MAGVTDLPFRQLCRRLGAGLVVSEMVTSDTRLWNTNKSRWRLDHQSEVSPRSVQIAGGSPEMMAEAAQANVKLGAEIIDINMGCPAKKVCNRAAGSALLRDEALVHSILKAVVDAVDVPVTLKIRTGWDQSLKNAVTIAQMAEDVGIQLLSVHGRTRADAFRGEAEYDTIAEVKQTVSMPVIANGDINSPAQAKQVLQHTGADAVMIGRAAQGNPWIFREINHYLETGHTLPGPSLDEAKQTILWHVSALHAFYGSYMGVRVARKHLSWYLNARGLQKNSFRHLLTLEDPSSQLGAINNILNNIEALKETAA